MITIHPLGAYSHRQPLAYAPVRAACAGQIALADRCADADVVVLAHARDLDRHGADLLRGLGAGQRVVLLSEEPLWDTVWSPDPLTRRQVWETEAGPLPVTVLNHETCDIYAFDRIPYFLLTEAHFFARYARWFSRNAGRSAADWRSLWAKARWDVGFLAEYREDATFDVRFDTRPALYGLGAARTRIALACGMAPEGPFGADRVLRSGAGWNTLPRRQDLPDWHLEKFLDLDGRLRLMSAIENTHQANYVSEKIFDAFAAGAVPLYVAEPGHRVHDIVPEGSFLNLAGLAPAEAAARIAGFTPDAGGLEAFMAAQRALADLFGSVQALVAERTRLAHALAVELQRVLDE